jgi:hypothetical protein
MNPDLIKKPKTRVVLRAWERLKSTYNEN